MQIVLFWASLAIILLIGAYVPYHFEKCKVLNALPQDSTFVTTRRFSHLGESHLVPLIHSNNHDSIDYSYCSVNKLERKKLSPYAMNLRGLSQQLGLSETGWPYAYNTVLNDSNLSNIFPSFGLGVGPLDDFGWDIRINHITKSSWDEVCIYPYQIILKDAQREFNMKKANEILDSAYYYFTKSPSSPFYYFLRGTPKDGFYHEDFIAASTSIFKDENQYEKALWSRIRNNTLIDFPVEKATMLIHDEKFRYEDWKKPILGYWSNDFAIVMLYCNVSTADLHLRFAKLWEVHRWASRILPFVMLLILIMLIEINLALLNSRRPIFIKLYRHLKLNHTATFFIASLTCALLVLVVTRELEERTSWSSIPFREQALPINGIDSIYESERGSIRYYFNSAKITEDSIKVDVSEHFTGGENINDPLSEVMDDTTCITTDEHRVLWVEQSVDF